MEIHGMAIGVDTFKLCVYKISVPRNDTERHIRDMEKIGYSIKEVCRMVGLSRLAIDKEIKKGNLKTSRIGSRHIITRKQIDEWLEQSVGKTK